MKRIIAKILLSLILLAIVIPSAGCKPRRGGYGGGGGSFTDVFVGGFLPSFGGGGYDEYYEEGYYDDGGFYDDGGYYDDGWYEEGYEEGWDDWKKKNAGRPKS